MKPAVAFVTPPSPFLLDERVFPSLGILKVAAVTERLGYPVEHLDLNGVEDYIKVLHSFLQQTTARTLCLTATTPQMPAIEKMVQAIREVGDYRVILGGPHPTVVVAAVRKELKKVQIGRATKELRRMMDAVDVLVAGDGEAIIGPVLGSRARLVVDADNPKSEPFLSSGEWSETPWPARHLIDMGSYKYEIDGKRIMSIVSQLGCPMGCLFCCGRDSGMLRRMRLRPAGQVIEEMRHVIQKYGAEGFMFMDDELNINKEMLDLMAGIKQIQKDDGVVLANRGFIKAELFTQEQADAMAEAGFRRVLCGFESGSVKILKNIRKGATVEDNTRMLKIAKAAGLEVKALMSLGHAGESRETVEETVAWLMSEQPADLDVTIITTYPGSPYYDDAVESKQRPEVWEYVAVNGDKLYQVDLDYATVADYYKGDPNDGYRSYVFTDGLTAKELVELRDWTERTVREELKIPFYAAGKALKIEASMGQLPGSVFRQGSEGGRNGS